jgi:hypothetical protein
MGRIGPGPVKGHTLVALILATGAALAVVTLAVGSVALNGPVSTEEATLLSTALGAIVGAVATYLGTRGGPAPPEPP